VTSKHIVSNPAINGISLKSECLLIFKTHKPWKIRVFVIINR
jgi:hypothetical protein